MDFHTLARERFSVLHYELRDVPPELIQVILDALPRPRLAFLVCWDRRESWVRPADGKSSGEIDAAIVTAHMMLQAADLGLGSI